MNNARNYIFRRVLTLGTPRNAPLQISKPVVHTPHVAWCISESPQRITIRNVSGASISHSLNSEDGFLRRIFGKYIYHGSKLKLKAAGYLLYEAAADHIDYKKFFQEFSMTDSFFSWYLITELHVWMIMVRAMAEPDANGRIIRNSIVEAMWDDVHTRAKVLAPQNTSSHKTNVQTLGEQFNAAMIGYDEGVNGDDKVLAGAIWRRIFQSEGNNPEDLERLVVYVRKQIHFLDNLPKDDLLNARVRWVRLDEV